MGKGEKQGFDYYLDPAMIKRYQEKPLELRLAWLYQGNVFRKGYPKSIIRLQDTFRVRGRSK